jgi:hypothetical protein
MWNDYYATFTESVVELLESTSYTDAIGQLSV